MKIDTTIVLGAGSVGLMTALTLKVKLPRLKVRVVRSPEIGVIGVGEGTTSAFPRHFFEYLKLKPQSFYREAEPTWKMGIRFLWGPRPEYFYTFSHEYEKRLPQLSRNNGFYYDEAHPWLGNASAFMAQNKVFPRRKDGLPQFHNNHAYHMENHKLVQWLETRCREAGVEITDATVTAEKGGAGIAGLVTEEGERLTADLYVDASGFRSELLAKALEEPYLSYSDALFCDRAVIGGWERKDEQILPYTTVETMDSGWAWRIDHENFINRGYVYSSAFISDEEALREFLAKNPQVTTTPRTVRFRSGRYRRNWVGNVVAVGNSAGFVEPLEATALQVICVQASTLADSLLDSLCEPTPSLIKLYNDYNGAQWDDIRNFLAVHYKFNTRVETPFWKACQEDTALHGGEAVVEFYRENGPSVLAGVALVHPTNSFKIDGYVAMLVGQKVPYDKTYAAPPQERLFWTQHCKALGEQARQGMTVEESLRAIRQPGLNWA